MAKFNDARRRPPSTPSLKLSREHLHIEHTTAATGQTSPPETPTTSPHMVRKPPRSGSFYRYSRPLAQDPNIKPVGIGHQFSYQRVPGREQLSPRSSSSSFRAHEGDSDAAPPQSAANSSIAGPSDGESESDGEESGGGDDEADEEDEEDEEDEDEEHAETYAQPNIRLASDPLSQPMSLDGSDADDSFPQSRVHVTSFSSTLTYDLVIEDIDPMDSGCEGLEILYPTEIESNRSRSRSRHKDFDGGMMQDFKNLNCSNETSDNDGEQVNTSVDEEALFRQRQQEIRRLRRVSMSSSFGKRTHSELSDSDDSDAGALDVNDLGSSARRMRKRLHRGSLLFQDPPAPRIEELEEPDSSEDEYAAADPFARELPYWTMEIMEMESS
ncbi:hypothetical protein QQS21_008662 [Conoideocrella luteorostrata]|uniref:Uncharacterized protein n=1 Tax=Conoideocrella luteorostrata TaxID=1105319 RepID=A0AAJ0CKV6_9HYPO|nr:hypothetical protein QQS21_008662 [Conoideocrella luteorostrata]